MCAPRINLKPPIERQPGRDLVRVAKASRLDPAPTRESGSEEAKPARPRVAIDADFFSSVG